MTERLTALQSHLRLLVQELALGYAWITLIPSWRIGLGLAALTFIQPQTGAVGLVAAVCAWYVAQGAGANALERPVCVFNGLLCGLFVAHVWTGGISLLALAVMSGLFSGWLSVVLGRLAWTLVQLPILSIPFALVAMLTAAAGGSLSRLRFEPYAAPPELLGGQADAFFSAFGGLYFMPIPWVGLAIVLVLLAASRYYLMLAVLGYCAASSWFALLGAAPEHLASTGWASNAILAALLVGGLFASPSLVTAAHAVLAAILAAWLSLALGRLLSPLQAVPFSIPFVLASWLVLYAAVRNARIAACFDLHRADFPERSYERTQVALARVGSPGSVPLALPFKGQWVVSQGFAGAQTHRGLWQHALDFIVVKAGKSFVNRGQQLEDFYCYNLPVLSPAYGQVWRVVNDVPDNAPGNVNLTANWGNCVVIRLADGKFVLLAHLKPASVAVYVGAWVKPGDVLGLCGNSGRSPQPHIHLHVQTSDLPGSPTTAFHLSSVMQAPPGQGVQFKLATVPVEGSTLAAAMEGEVRPLYLLAGRGLSYTVTRDGESMGTWRIWCEIDSQSRMVIRTSSGASCVVESPWAVFSCYERNTVPDIWFDLWLLGCGYTPVSLQVESWEDTRVPARWLPGRHARWAAALVWPWATFAKGSFTRGWNASTQSWQQQASHRQAMTGIGARVVADIAPQTGCTRIEASMGRHRYTLQADSSFQRADMGVPAWEYPLQLH